MISIIPKSLSMAKALSPSDIDAYLSALPKAEVLGDVAVADVLDFTATESRAVDDFVPVALLVAAVSSLSLLLSSFGGGVTRAFGVFSF